MKDVGLCFCLSLSLPLEVKVSLKCVTGKLSVPCADSRPDFYPKFAMYGWATYADFCFVIFANVSLWSLSFTGF